MIEMKLEEWMELSVVCCDGSKEETNREIVHLVLLL